MYAAGDRQRQSGQVARIPRAARAAWVSTSPRRTELGVIGPRGDRRHFPRECAVEGPACRDHEHRRGGRWPMTRASKWMRSTEPPGVDSARYAGVGGGDAANNAKLLRALAGVPGRGTHACYRCVLVFVAGPDDPRRCTAEGVWAGADAGGAAGGAGRLWLRPLFPGCRNSTCHGGGTRRPRKRTV